MAHATPMGPARLPARRLVIGLAAFAAVSALGGGAALMANPHGSPWLPPVALLARTPFQTFLGPGLLLAGVVGGASLACALLWWRRGRGARDVLLLAGGALTLWIGAQVAMLQTVSWLHLLYGALGVLLLGLGAFATWRAPRARPRYVVRVTLAEALGYLAPATVAILLTRADAQGLGLVRGLVVAGLVEGLVLGTGQAFALPFRVHRLRFAGLTALGTAAVWASVVTARLAFEAPAVPLAARVALALVAGVVGLGGLGFAQWLELRHHAARAWRWILWTALAWIVALPLSFAPGPLVDETTPLAVHLVLWGAGGALMAYVMALVTWQGARRLAPPDAAL